MLGTIINSVSVFIGSILGMFFGKNLPEKIGDGVLHTFGLFIIYLGVQGAMESQNTMIVILSLVFGAILGGILNIEGHVEALAFKLKEKLGREDDTIAAGFITGSLLFCAGAMGVVGALQGGLSNDHTMLFTKSILDLISSFFLASSLGIGVLFSGIAVLLYQGGFVLLAWLIGPFLTAEMIIEIGTIGSLLLIGLGLNILKATDLPLMNFIPAIFLPIVFFFISTLF